MSRNSTNLREDLKELQRNDLEDVVKVQTYVVGVTMGVQPFEHPGAPSQQPGARYQPNSTELDFTRTSRSTLYSNFFRLAFVGAFTPYVTLRLLSVAQKRVIPRGRYVLWSSLGGAFGGTYGLTLGRVAIAREYLRLENSPLATEARYQLWKVNPKHPFLRGFEHEIHDWTEYMYNRHDDDDDDDDRGRSTNLYEQYDDRYTQQRQSRPSQQRGRGRERDRGRRDEYDDDKEDLSGFVNYDDNMNTNNRDNRRRRRRDQMDDRDDNVNMNEMVRDKKRSQFYNNRKELDNKDSGYYDYDDVNKTFGDHSTPQEDVSGFFDKRDDDFENKQKWD